LIGARRAGFGKSDQVVEDCHLFLAPMAGGGSHQLEPVAKATP
jgi:hypothetical protein